MKCVTGAVVAALAVTTVEAYPKFFNGMTWANFAWEVNPKEQTVLQKDMVLVDAFDASKATIASIKNKQAGAKVVCYISAGTWESWRPDASQFSKSLLKEQYYKGSDREYWFDITQWSALKPHMMRRFKMAKDKGCDGIELDNQDCYINGPSCYKGKSYDTLKSDQIAYAKWSSEEIHRTDMAVGLKNAMEIMKALEPNYDFAINEECAQYGECGIYRTFTKDDKAVFGVEYNGQSHCDEAEKEGISRKYKTTGGHWEDCQWTVVARAARMKKQEVEMAAAAAAQGSGPNVGAIVGGIIGGIACVALLAGGGFYMYKKKAGSTESTFDILNESTSDVNA